MTTPTENEQTAQNSSAEPPTGYVFDFFGNPVKKECTTCQGCIHESSDDYGYGAGYVYCEIKPHMGNLKGFPFKSELKCWVLDSIFTIDWEKDL